MTEVLKAGKRRRILPEEVQAGRKATATDEAEPAGQAGPSHAEHSTLVLEQPQGPRRVQPERVHPEPLPSGGMEQGPERDPDGQDPGQAQNLAARVLPVEGNGPGNPQSAVTTPGDSSERSVGSDAGSETLDASMSEADQPLQDEEELGSDDEVGSQDRDSESLQATTVSQGQASDSSTLSSPEDAPAASGEVVVAHQEVQGMCLTVARACQVHVAHQHTTSVTGWLRSPCVDGELRCWQQRMGRELLLHGSQPVQMRCLRPFSTAEDMWASLRVVAASGAA